MDGNKVKEGRKELFELFDGVQPGDTGKCRCKVCGHMTQANKSGRYSNMWEHVLSEHPEKV